MIMSSDIERNTEIKTDNKKRFSDNHPKLSVLLGIIFILAVAVLFVFILYLLIKYFGIGILKIVQWISTIVSSLDAVVIVALITAGVSIFSVIFTSVIGKLIEFRKNRQTYLAQKREAPYGDFVDMFYKIMLFSKKGDKYTQEDMITDFEKFSKQLTLWGSSRVVKKWVKFRENVDNPEKAKENLFLLEKIMNDMRKDLGQNRVGKGNLLGFIVNDIKENK